MKKAPGRRELTPRREQSKVLVGSCRKSSHWPNERRNREKVAEKKSRGAGVFGVV